MFMCQIYGLLNNLHVKYLNYEMFTCQIINECLLVEYLILHVKYRNLDMITSQIFYLKIFTCQIFYCSNRAVSED